MSVCYYCYDCQRMTSGLCWRHAVMGYRLWRENGLQSVVQATVVVELAPDVPEGSEEAH